MLLLSSVSFLLAGLGPTLGLGFRPVQSLAFLLPDRHGLHGSTAPPMLGGAGVFAVPFVLWHGPRDLVVDRPLGGVTCFHPLWPGLRPWLCEPCVRRSARRFSAGLLCSLCGGRSYVIFYVGFSVTP